jgi:hypothetical protein
VERRPQAAGPNVALAAQAWARIAVRRDHDDWHVRPRSPRFGQQVKATHPRHVDVGKNQDQRGSFCIHDALERGGTGLGELHGEAARAQVMPELLAKKHLNIRLIVHYQNQECHACLPD